MLSLYGPLKRIEFNFQIYKIVRRVTRINANTNKTKRKRIIYIRALIRYWAFWSFLLCNSICIKINAYIITRRTLVTIHKNIIQCTITDIAIDYINIYIVFFFEISPFTGKHLSYSITKFDSII